MTGEGKQSSKTPTLRNSSSLYEITSRKKLLLISTGGTIASRVDYRTGAVHPVCLPRTCMNQFRNLINIASVEPEVVFSIYSENMIPTDWGILSSRIIELSNSRKPAGVVVMMGTDTLAYAAAALSFSLIDFEIPVVVVGAQRSSDRPSSDAAINLTAAALFALDSERPGVYIAMHQNENDEVVAIHSGVRVRKNHTSKRDAFTSIDALPIALVRGREIIWNKDEASLLQMTIPDEFKLKTKFESAVGLVKFHPGFRSWET